ncbi:MAG: divalent metal cation transporter [Planctomycetaceae bacterium]|nr:divalent metal cation transporter [Planctomycetaceae bacterium]
MTNSDQSIPDGGDSADRVRRPWWQSIGPGLVTACVVIGPGSILTSSQVGAREGYSRAWVVLIAVIFMMAYVTMAARLGAVARQSTGDIITQRAGRWLAVLMGICVFLISATFQFGNNLGAHSAIAAFVPWNHWVLVLNAVSIAFVFAFRNLYAALERLMTFFVAVMLISFAVNLWFAQPNIGEFAQGLIPSAGSAEIGLELLGLIGTTFVISAAYYQSYLVRFRGWTKDDLPAGLVDARVGGAIMLLITLMIMSTAAAVLRGQELKDVGQVAQQLEPLFGTKGRIIFCIGLFSAAFSSFIINSMIGGFILSDGLGLGSVPTERVPRILTTVVLLTGMLVAMYVLNTGRKPVNAIIAAQAVTVLAAPLMAGVLLWLTNLRSVMGEFRNGLVLNLFGIGGLILLLVTARYTAVEKVWPEVEKLLNPPPAAIPVGHFE